MGTVTGPWEHTLEHTLVCIFSFFSISFFLFALPLCYLFAIELFIFLSLFHFSPGAANLLQTVEWSHLSLDRHGQPNTQRIALFLEAFVCSTTKRKSIIHEALEALPERRICTSAMGFNGTLGGI